MKKRLLCLGLVAAVLPLLGTGCGHPVARFRANHPCLSCGPVAHPALHPIQTRRAILSEHGVPVGYPVASGPVVGPVAPPCHGCNSGGAPGIPVSLSGGYTEGAPFAPGGYPPIVISSQGSPSIGSPMPIAPGNQLPHPMPLNKQQ